MFPKGIILAIAVAAYSPCSASRLLRHEELLQETHEGFALDQLSVGVNISVNTCGEVITTPNYGPFIKISYKANEALAPNEHCTWMVAGTARSTYHVILEKPDVEQDDAFLTLTAFRKGRTTFTTITPTSFFTNVTQANILLINLSAQQDVQNKTGFTLYILPGTASDSSVSSYSVNRQVDTEQIFTYPSSGAYKHSEMSTFLFPLRENEGGQKFVYRQISMEPNCNDYIAAFFFNSAEGSWNYSDRICGNQTTATISSTETTLLIFDTDSNHISTYSGFDLSVVKTRC